MKILSILFGFTVGVLLITEINLHGFFHAISITIVYICLVILIKKWLTGEMDEAEYENPTYPKGVLGYSGNDKKEK